MKLFNLIPVKTILGLSLIALAIGSSYAAFRCWDYSLSHTNSAWTGLLAKSTWLFSFGVWVLPVLGIFVIFSEQIFNPVDNFRPKR